MSANSNLARDILRRNLNNARNQVSIYADLITDEARLDAYRSLGIDRIRWVSVEDSKRCAECAERHGQIYPIDFIPVKHRHCRCRLEPVFSDSTGENQ